MRRGGGLAGAWRRDPHRRGNGGCEAEVVQQGLRCRCCPWEPRTGRSPGPAPGTPAPAGGAAGEPLLVPLCQLRSCRRPARQVALPGVRAPEGGRQGGCLPAFLPLRLTFPFPSWLRSAGAQRGKGQGWRTPPVGAHTLGSRPPPSLPAQGPSLRPTGPSAGAPHAGAVLSAPSVGRAGRRLPACPARPRTEPVGVCIFASSSPGTCFVTSAEGWRFRHRFHQELLVCGDRTPVWSDPGPGLLEGSGCMAPALQTSCREVVVVGAGSRQQAGACCPLRSALRGSASGVGGRRGRAGGLCHWGPWPLDPPPPPSTGQAPRLRVAGLGPDLQPRRGSGSWA